MGKRSHRVTSLLAAGTACALALAAALPVTAVVVFEPKKEPPPQRWEVSVPITVEWADVSMLFPETWTARAKRAPGVDVQGASLLVAFGPDESMCMLERYRAGSVETWQDVGVNPTAVLTIDGRKVERFDDMLGYGGPAASAYSIHAGEQLYSLWCSADQAPLDRWLSIAETITLP